MLRPNVGDGKTHIFYVICGAGTHSENKQGVLKVAVQEWLRQRGDLDYWEDIKNGIFFVLVSK